jgi:hypothetical protein
VSDEFQDLDEMLGFLGEEGRHRRDPEEHPSPEILTAYQANKLTPEEDLRIQDHLAVCHHCTELLLDLEEFLRAPVETAEPADEFKAAADWKRLPMVAAEPAANLEAAADWKRLRREIGQKRKDAREQPAGTNSFGGFFGSPKAAYAVAAVFATLALGMSLYVQSLRQDLRSSELNSRTVFLPSTPAVRGGEDLAGIVELSHGEEKLIAIVLNLPPSASYPEYRIEIRQHGRKVLDLGGLEAQQPDGIIFTLSSKILVPGRYDITLKGLKPGKADAVGKYELEIVRK